MVLLNGCIEVKMDVEGNLYPLSESNKIEEKSINCSNPENYDVSQIYYDFEPYGEWYPSLNEGVFQINTQEKNVGCTKLIPLGREEEGVPIYGKIRIYKDAKLIYEYKDNLIISTSLRPGGMAFGIKMILDPDPHANDFQFVVKEKGNYLFRIDIINNQNNKILITKEKEYFLK